MSYLAWWALYPATIRAASDPATAGRDSRPACDKAYRHRGISSHDRYRRRREKFVSGQAAGRRATVVSARRPDADAAAAAAVDVTVGVAAAVAVVAVGVAGPGTGWEGGQGGGRWPEVWTGPSPAGGAGGGDSTCPAPQRNNNPSSLILYTDKKENQIFLIYQEINIGQLQSLYD